MAVGSRNFDFPTIALRTFILVFLGACGGEEDGEEAGPIPSVSYSVLSNFFVESFAAFEDSAQQLVTQNPRYLVQESAWYFDSNGNGRRDSETEEFYNTYPLQSSGIHYAHAAGLTGAGQIVSITDNGFLNSHEAFAGRTITETGSLPTEDHGTQVASVVAGNSSTMIGMAPGADLAFGSFATFETLAAATRLAGQLGAVAQNNSWGFVNAPVGQASFEQVFNSVASYDYLASLNSYTRTGVVIFAASNNYSDTSADLMVALPSMEVGVGLEAGWLAVINADAQMNGDDVVGARRISAACLEAAAWCLAAEGSWYAATATATDSYAFNTGSSFAAPMVAGAMAILGEAFPDMPPHELRIRLLASADNEFTGFFATSEIELVNGYTRAISAEWGHGFLDVKAALLPIGTTTATLTDGGVYDISGPLAVEGAASGDAFTRALTGVSLAVDDSLGAGFSLPAGQLVAAQSPRPLVVGLLRDWESGHMANCCGIASFFPEARLTSFSSEDFTLSVIFHDDQSADVGFGGSLSHRFQTGLGEVSVSLGLGQDKGTLLPRWHSGGGGAILTSGVSLLAPFSDKLSFTLGTDFGSTLGDMGGADGTAALNAARAGIVATDLFSEGDRLSLSVELPMAVTTGATSLILPIATPNGTITQKAVHVDLAPDNREVRFGLSYDLALSERSGIALSAAYAENFGNITNSYDTAVFVGFRSRF
jgi:hypothetical protein